MPQINLSRYEHPNDPRVVITDDEEVFFAAVASPVYQAAILERDVPSGLYPALVGAWEENNAHYKGRKPNSGYIRSLKPFVRNSGVVTSGDPLIISAFSQITDAFTRISGRGDDWIDVKPLANVVVSNHPHHEYDVLNTVWGSEGTGWFNREGKPLYVPEGAWFHFQKSFWHFSSPMKDPDQPHEQPRIALVLRDAHPGR